MPVQVDWEAVRQSYGQGASKQALSIKHGVSRQAILKRARKEHWVTPLVASPVTHTLPVELAKLSPVEIVKDEMTMKY